MTLWSFVGRTCSWVDIIADFHFNRLSRLTWIIPFYSQVSIGPWKSHAITLCFGSICLQEYSPCLPRCPRFFSSCSLDNLGSSLPVGSSSVSGWWHCWLVSWVCGRSIPAFAFAFGCRSFLIRLFVPVWPMEFAFITLQVSEPYRE